MKFKTITMTLVGCLLISGTALAFPDSDGHWADNSIKKLSSRGIIKGYEDKTFRPNNSISREEVSKIISACIGSEGNVDLSTISIDSQSRWSSASVANLIARGIARGYEDGSFNPEGKITRAEVCEMVYKAMQSNSFEFKLENNKDFDDIGSHWSRTSVEQLSGCGIIKGYEDGSFNPDKNITRAEVCTIINSVIDKGGF